MAKTIGLKQLAQKKYNIVEGLPEKYKNSIGEIEDAWDAIIYGNSGNGKSSFNAEFVVALIEAMKCTGEYVTYEEGHGKTVQDTFIRRYNMLERLGNALKITDHLNYDELRMRMAKKKSAKIWIIDSLQAARFTAEQCALLKQDFVLSKKKKIIIYVSWAKGVKPHGSAAGSVEYYANIKMYVKDFIMFPRSRYGGNQPYVIWEGDEKNGARSKWGDQFEKVAGLTKPKKRKASPKPKAESAEKIKHITSQAPVTKLVIDNPETKPITVWGKELKQTV